MSIRKRYRELMKRGGGIFTPGAYDALSARILEMQGFEAVNAGGYATIGALLGQPDTGQSNMRDVADSYARICAAVDIPVYTDADTGFGGVNNVRQMVRAFERAGVAGFHFSDQVFPNRCGFMTGKQVIPIEHMIAKIKSALDARRDPDLFITARTDALAVDGIDAAIERAQIYKELGVDMAKINGTNDIEQYKRIRREVPGPQTATMSEANDNPKVTIAQFKEAGAEMISFPSATLFASALAITRVGEALMRDGSLANVRDHILKLPDYYKIVRLKEQQDQEARYEAEAAAIMASRRAAAE